MKSVILSVLCVTLALVEPVYAESKTVPSVPATKGYTCLFMGHSFFFPIARGFEGHARRAGFQDHEQLSVGSGGVTGTPGHFWVKGSKEKKEQMLTFLASGEVDLVGFTYHPEGMCEVEDYARWVEVALKHNPETRFFIGLSWSRKPVRPIDEFADGNKSGRDTLCKKIDALRERFPGATFFLVNYGAAVVELKRQFEAGKFPEIDRLVNAKGQKGSHLFRDPLGHAGPHVIEMAQLVWLSAIYQTDLSEYDREPHPEVDFKAIASRAVAAEPYSKFSASKSR